MAKTYRLSPGTRLINSLFRVLTRLGLGASYRHILTVPGRETARLYSTPVDIIELDGERWLVAGYGPYFRVEEAEGPAAVPVLRKYVTKIRVTRPYFDAAPDSPDEDVAAELRRHPVFRVIPRNGAHEKDASG